MYQIIIYGNSFFSALFYIATFYRIWWPLDVFHTVNCGDAQRNRNLFRTKYEIWDLVYICVWFTFYAYPLYVHTKMAKMNRIYDCDFHSTKVLIFILRLRLYLCLCVTSIMVVDSRGRCFEYKVMLTRIACRVCVAQSNQTHKHSLQINTNIPFEYIFIHYLHIHSIFNGLSRWFVSLRFLNVFFICWDSKIGSRYRKHR